jgi:uncharacterized protein YprB with RNaseH-like and TPR domain
MSDLRGQLDKLAKQHNLVTGRQWMQRRAEEAESRASGAFDIEAIVPGQVQGTEDAGFYLVRTEFPLAHPHGNLSLGEVLTCAPEHIAFSAADDELLDFDPRTACFVDTETIGLAGGAGTVAFLVGLGYFTEESFRLDQCFLRDYDDEEAMLDFVAERFRFCDTVVGYNSKSFDLPLLRTRFIQNRIPFHAEALPHYDLVHATRRFYRKRLGDCSLKNIESEILGIARKGDIPSHLIPQIWFDYLRNRDARPLKPVFYHHRMDILSLVTLTAHLARAIEHQHGDGFHHTEDRLSLIRHHFRLKQYETLIPLAEKYLEDDERSPLRRDCLEMLAFACKRRNHFEKMRDTLELLVQEFPTHWLARHELAKLYQHRLRDLDRAMRICREALAALPPSATIETQAFTQRLARLEDRFNRSHPAPPSDTFSTTD